MKDLKGKKILILKLRYIGDTLSLIPVIENLNEKAADLSVDVMVNRGTEEVLTTHPGIGKLWVYDRSKAKKNIISSISYHSHLIKSLRLEKYEVVIDFTHGDRAAFISFLTGASERISYRQSSGLSRLLMNHLIDEDPHKQHIVDYQLHALRAFGLDHFSRSATLHIPETVQERIDGLLAESGLGRDSPKVVIHPGARGKLRQWAPARFAEIARRFVEFYRADIILIGGSEEGDLVEEVQRFMGFSPALKTTRLSLLEMGAL
ncbi:MAG: glycosyltransferase family 9 protein, partial [Pseudomonadota bacterium]